MYDLKFCPSLVSTLWLTISKHPKIAKDQLNLCNSYIAKDVRIFVAISSNSSGPFSCGVYVNASYLHFVRELLIKDAIDKDGKCDADVESDSESELVSVHSSLERALPASKQDIWEMNEVDDFENLALIESDEEDGLILSEEPQNP